MDFHPKSFNTLSKSAVRYITKTRCMYLHITKNIRTISRTYCCFGFLSSAYKIGNIILIEFQLIE